MELEDIEKQEILVLWRNFWKDSQREWVQIEKLNHNLYRITEAGSPGTLYRSVFKNLPSKFIELGPFQEKPLNGNNIDWRNVDSK